MIHISSAKNGKFHVTGISKNGEPVHNAQNVKSKQGAWSNIKASMKLWNSPQVHVQDDTQKVPVVYYVTYDHFGTKKFMKSIDTITKPEKVHGKSVAKTPSKTRQAVN